VRGLRMSYGDFEAVRGIDLEVEHGEIFAFVGPNVAGKTTTVEMLEGYRPRRAGEVAVLGVDPATPTRAWRARIGVVLQTCQLPGELTVRELLSRYGGYYPAPRPVAETIALVGLEDKRDTRAGRLSGGQQRRLDVALALIGDPELIFLDEPTTGFDPGARRQFWGVIAGLRDLGKTVFLTTHYMDEAQALADRVAIIAGGRIVAQDTPSRLGGRDRAACEIRFRLPEPHDPADLPRLNDANTAVEGAEVRVRTGAPQATLWTLLGWSRDRGVELLALEVARPSLEDIYLELVGRS
jgi:ABC-2 type transport system ATP-binding protein